MSADQQSNHQHNLRRSSRRPACDQHSLNPNHNNFMKMHMIIRRFAGALFSSASCSHTTTVRTGSGSPRLSASTCCNRHSRISVRWSSFSKKAEWAGLAVTAIRLELLLLRKMKRQLGFLGMLLLCSLAAERGQPWTLERALDYALAHNPDTRIAQQRIAAAQAGLEQANSTFWPRLQVQSSYTRTDNPMLAFGSILNQQCIALHSTSTTFPPRTTSMPEHCHRAALRGRTKCRGATSGQGEHRSRQARECRVQNALGFEVTRAFLTVLKTRQFILAAEAAVNSFQTNLVAANHRLDGGTLLKSDVLDIEVRLAQAREDLVRARNSNTLAERALRNLLGIESGEFSVADTAPVASVPHSEDFSQRPELAAARERESAAQAQVRGSKSGYQPRVSAFVVSTTITDGHGR